MRGGDGWMAGMCVMTTRREGEKNIIDGVFFFPAPLDPPAHGCGFRRVHFIL